MSRARIRGQEEERQEIFGGAGGAQRTEERNPLEAARRFEEERKVGCAGGARKERGGSPKEAFPQRKEEERRFEEHQRKEEERRPEEKKKTEEQHLGGEGDRRGIRGRHLTFFPLDDPSAVGEGILPVGPRGGGAMAGSGPGDGEPEVARAIRPPIRPTTDMVDRHMISHLPFRNWCSFCVRGRGQSVPHVKVTRKEEEQLPVISVDYGFSGTLDTAATDLPMLVVFDRWSKSIWSHPVPTKGLEHPHGSRCLLNDLRETGYKRLVLKSDQEHSIRAVCREVQNGFEGEVVPEAAPIEDHAKSNGEAEVSVKRVHGLSRTLREAVQHGIGDTIPGTHPVLAWLVEYSGVLITLFGISDDGLTPYHRLKGRPWRIPLPPFGEEVEFRTRTRDKLESRWQNGIYLGIKRTTSEKIVSDGTGKVLVVQTLRRTPGRYNKDLLLKVRGTPWEPKGESLRGEEDRPVELPAPITIVPELPDVPSQAPAAFTQEGAPRRVYITKKNLDRYGYTAGCPACEGTKMGIRTSGEFHTAACRTRLEAAMKQDPVESARVERSEQKRRRGSGGAEGQDGSERS